MSLKRLRLIRVVATTTLRSAIVQRGRVQIGGRVISEYPAQLVHKMTFSMQFSLALGDWQSKTANISRFTILANIESSAWPAKRRPNADIHQPRWVGADYGSAEGLKRSKD